MSKTKCICKCESYRIFFPSQAISASLSLLSAVASLASFVALTIHLYQLFFAIPRCNQIPLDTASAPDWLRNILALTRSETKTCICDRGHLGEEDNLNYPGLTCPEVRGVMPLFLTVSSTLYFAGFFFSVWFFCAAAKSLREKRDVAGNESLLPSTAV